MANVPVTPLFLINLGVSSIIGGGLILYSLRGNWRSRLYLFFFSVAIMPLGISWCIASDRHMPEASFNMIVNELDLLPEKTMFVTSAEYMPAVAWSNKHMFISDAANGLPESHGNPVCVIMTVDNENWSKLPKPDKDMICNGFRAALYHGNTDNN